MATSPTTDPSMNSDLDLNFAALNLANELPDSDVLLFSPTIPRSRCKRLESFTLFPNLPLEIRDIIWALTFTKRRIHVYLYWKDPEEDRSMRLHSIAPPPAIFHVNAESRSVGLKSYSVLLRYSFRHALRTCPIYFHPVLDTVVFPNTHAMDQGWYFDAISVDLRVILGSIQCLELHNMYWTEARNTSLNRYSSISTHPWGAQVSSNIAVLRHFSGVRNLVLTVTDRSCGTLIGEEGREQCKSTLAKYLAAIFEHIPGYEAPTISIHSPSI